jgi:putative addiction module component (TIGR02574 family)
MSDAVLTLFAALRELYAEERAGIAHRLWESLPNIKEDVYTYYDQEMVDEILDRIEYVRQSGPNRLTTDGDTLCQQALAFSREDRGDLVHLLWQSLPSMYGIFGTNDPDFIAEINRRIAECESGKEKGIPAEEVFRHLKEKYG